MKSKHPFFAVPRVMNMGFHYPLPYARRTRIHVLGISRLGTPEWEKWYRDMHEYPELRKMADAGYDLLEIHFSYNFGVEAEREDIELAAKMTANAHRCGMTVLGYLQFFSVQEETFFIEHPWAEKCVQLDSGGKRIEYSYDRPALCFEHPEVRRYFLDTVTLGIERCGLDGIRLDNDYVIGCYCPLCRQAFRRYLAEKYPPEAAKRVFGFPDLSRAVMPPGPVPGDPMWLELTRFRRRQRQEFLLEIRRHLSALKPDAVLGGNPATERTPDNDTFRHFYPADLGETHDLVCAENVFFPGLRPDGEFRYQASIYKFGEACGFAVFPSHHLKSGERTPLPNARQCALSFAEALAMGGHLLCTTWGIRHDPEGAGTLYRRPEYLAVLKTYRDFAAEHAFIWKDAVCDAPIGIYVNADSRAMFPEETWKAYHEALDHCLRSGIAFRLICRDTPEMLSGIRTLIVPDMRIIAEREYETLRDAPELSIVPLGDPGRFDEFFRRRKDVSFPRTGAMPKGLNIGPYTAVSRTVTPDGRRFLHILNYDPDHPAAVRPEDFQAKAVYLPAGEKPEALETYCVLELP